MTLIAIQDTLRETANSAVAGTTVLTRMEPWMVALLVGATLFALLLSLWMIPDNSRPVQS